MFKKSIVYISKTTNEKLTFMTETNTLNNKQMWWTKEYPQDMYSGNLKTVKNLIKGLYENCKIIEES